MPPLSTEEAKRLAIFRYIKGEGGIPRNDGNPLMKGRWIDHCEEHVGNTENSLLTLVTQGVMLTREGTICSTLEQASDIVHGYFTPHVWSDPSPLTYVRTPAIDAHRTAVSGGLPLPDFTVATLPRGYIISPPHLSEASARLCNIILATYIAELEQSRNAMRTKCGRDGLELIRLEYAAVRRHLDKRACDAIEVAMNGFMQVGLTELSQPCFAELRGDYEGWNKVQEGPRTIPPTLVAGKYVNLMSRHLSDTEFLRFEGLMERKAAHGDLDLTVECIETTLARFTSESMLDAYKSGKVLQAQGGGKDTIKPGERLTVDQRIANGERAPGPCPYPGCGKEHWLKHCPVKAAKEKEATDKAKAKKAKAKAKKIAAKKKAAAAGGDSDDDGDDAASQSSGRVNLTIANGGTDAEPAEISISQLFAGAPGERVSGAALDACGR